MSQATIFYGEGCKYQTIAASQSLIVLGNRGRSNDLFVGLLVIPTTTSPGEILIRDGEEGDISVFAGGATSITTLHPFWIPLGLRSRSGKWRVTTGANMSVIAVGEFS